MALIRQVGERPSVDHPAFAMVDGLATCEHCNVSLSFYDSLFHDCVTPNLERNFALSAPRVDENSKPS